MTCEETFQNLLKSFKSCGGGSLEGSNEGKMVKIKQKEEVL